MMYLAQRGRNTLIATLIAATALFSAVRPAPSKEPVEQFLDALRRLEMHDMAVMYLDTLKTKQNLAPELKKLLPYEEGVSLVAGSRSILDVKRRMEDLDSAADRFAEFVKKNPQHARVPMANTQLGNVLVERAKVELEKSKKPLNADKKDELIAEARKLFAEARKVFENADKQFETAEKAFKKNIDKKTEYDLYQAREQVRRDFMQARLFAATVVYEASKAYPEGSKEWKELLTESAKRYTAINERWRNRVAGLYALMWAGRSYQELGDRKKAQGLYLELLAVMTGPGDDVINSLTAQTTVFYINCLIHKDEKKPNYEEAIKRADEWLKMVPKGFHSTADGLAVQWMMALCKKAQIDAIETAIKKETEANAKRKMEADKSRLTREAIKFAMAVKQYQNQYREPAIELINDLRNIDTPEGPPTTFADARRLAQEILESSELAKRQAKTEKDPKKKKELLEQMEKDRNAAMENFELAMRLRYNSEEPIAVDHVNRIRYILCYLNYQRENYYEAAILGEYLASNYPTTTGARPSAKIAMVSYQQTYSASGDQNAEFDLAQVQKMAGLIVERWPEEPEADEALMTLADIHARARRKEEAIRVLRRVKPDSPNRALADVKLGQTIWALYLGKAKTPEANPEELNALKKEAEQYLVKGVNALRKNTSAENPPVYDLLTGEVYLAQLFIDTGRPNKAIELLELKPLGLLDLVEKKYALTEYGNIRPETYKAAMRAYVSLNRPDDAEKMMNGLEKEYGKSKADQEKLTRIYIALGRDLQVQVKNKEEAGNRAELNELLENFELFLKRIAARPGNGFATHNWIASTYFGLGEGMEKDDLPTTASMKYFDLAGKEYDRIRNLMVQDPELGPEDKSKRGPYLKTLQVKIVECKRRAGKFEQAMNDLRAILTENAMTIDTQIEAANTMQQWGAVLGRRNAAEGKEKYKAAMIGERVRDEETRRPKYIVWGWAHMAALLQKAMAKNPSFADYFYQARFNLAYCRFMQAKLSKGSERDDLLEKATNDILIVVRLYPGLAAEPGDLEKIDGERAKIIFSTGMQWQDRYDSLFRYVRKEAGQVVTLKSYIKDQAKARAKAGG